VILVDTSIWIDFLGPRPGPAARRLDNLITADIPFALTPVILQEILQGARSESEFRRLHASLTTHRFIYPIHSIDTHVAAAGLYSRCRARGVTPRSSVDCLIAQITIENEAALMHSDADFNHMARIVPELAIYTG
jgi:hypothetical protein